MRVLLKLDLDCSADSAWARLIDPRSLQQLYTPLITVTPLAPGGFPSELAAGEHEVAVSVFGIVPLGTQIISPRVLQRRGGVRMLRDGGPTTSGLLAIITHWEHSMAVSPLPDGRTRYRDQLRFSAGALTPVVWPVMWALWQWRARRVARLFSVRG